MNKPDSRPRRNADKDLTELVRILDKLDFNDFMSLFYLLENYRNKTSTLRIARLLYDALSAGRIRRVRELVAPAPKSTGRTGRDLLWPLIR